ncbi:hypothetical protein AAFC00_007137 [Neodothiora populina]|uniref:SET domain-containing protein n=1 Tax=Neodothiora populina TaxID=2781224 RepID=A0ABR3PIG0_9PEZI
MSPSFLDYRISPSNVYAIICHRRLHGHEQYLVRWHSNHPDNAVISWHTLKELRECLHLVQDYVKVALSGPRPPPTTPINDAKNDNTNNSKDRKGGRKRKLLDDGDLSSSASSGYSKDSSYSSVSSSKSARHEVYNGILQRKAGHLIAKESHVSDPSIPHIMNVSSLPDAAMLSEASNTSVYAALWQIRLVFLKQISRLPGPAKLTFCNNLDLETPSLHFRWVQDYVLGQGVSKMDDETILGCSKCKPDMGARRGCEYTQKCDCLEYAEPDPSKAMTESQQAIYEVYLVDRSTDTTGLPKRFPYINTGPRAGCLDRFYLESRYVIYECNHKCRCGPKCKTRNVQFGRKVDLEIFKTANRGFGLRALEPLRKGQFIDKYLGELITDEEADRRETLQTSASSYLFWLDKHMISDPNDKEAEAKSEYPAFSDGGPPRQKDCYVADSTLIGGPTRYINHSCEPNCRLFTVSYNKSDQRIYDLAFFALEDIEKGEELTFDYVDPDVDDEEEDVNEDDTSIEDEDLAMWERGSGRRGTGAADAAAAASSKGNVVNSNSATRTLGSSGGKKKQTVSCHCGAARCRGVMWE